MEATITTWIPLLALFVALASPAVSWYVARRKTASEVRLISADTYAKLVESVDKQEARLSALRDEIDEMRLRIAHLESEAHTLTTRLRVLEQYTRRLVNQLRKAGMTPDIPQDVIDDLFSGSGSGTGV